MEKILIDTCIFIDIFRGNRILLEEIIKLPNSFINSIIYMELVQGARNKTELQKILRFLKRFKMIFIDEIISQKAMELIVSYNLSYNLLLADAIIAATCLTKGLKLFTFNRKDFAYIEGIKFFDLKIK